MATAKLVLAIWLIDQVVRPRAWQLVHRGQLKVLSLVSLAHLDIIRFVFKLEYFKVMLDVCWAVRIELHCSHS